FLGLSIALASIADMFSARPFDGIVPVPYSRDGIGVRTTAPGSPAQQAGIRPGECVEGMGRRIVNTTSDASAELQRHAIGETILYLVKAGPSGPGPGETRTASVRLSSERLGGTTYLYDAALGFLFFLIGFFVFWRVPEDRSARIFFLLCVLFLLFFVCRLRPASYWWIDVFVQNTGTISLFLLPAVFLHFFLIFPRAKRVAFAVPDEWTGESPPAWKTWLQEFLSASPGLLYLIYAIPPFVFLYDVVRQMRGEHVAVLSGAPLSSWILLGDYLVLGLVALAHSAFTLEDARERRQAFHVFVGTIIGTGPFLLLGIVLPSAFGIDDFVFYGIVPMILIPLTFAYAIVRFQMLNVRVIVRRTFLYAATTAVLFGFYALAIWAANQLFASSRLGSSPLFTFGFFLVVIPLFEFARRRLQTPLDKLFFREKFDYQSALLEMSEAITGELDLGRIADYLTASVSATMRVQKASIWLLDAQGWLERRGRREDRLSAGAAVRRVLRREGRPSSPDELSLHFADPESEEFRARLSAEGFRLLVPLVYRERLMGVLALQEKLSGERFDREDESFLSTLANQAALAIETALLHDEMTRQAEFRRDLEIARDIQASLLPRT
ncbi:MAG: GAF domain-containing protein, partial [Thermoanaerobaculia bacterium]